MSQDGRTILITGGTGSAGSALVRYWVQGEEYRRIIVFSRDELKQHELRMALPQDERLRWFLGDVRDRERLRRAFTGVHHVIHAAALKQVLTCEYNPAEAVQTNVQGSANVIEAAIDAGVEKVLLLSTDKAVEPVTLYGATKLTAERLFVAGGVYGQRTRFACTRYGNVLGSRGSALQVFRQQRDSGRPFTITDRRATRFWMTLDRAVHFVRDALYLMRGGEIFVPDLKAACIMDIVRCLMQSDLQPSVTQTGLRGGEKLHEVLISTHEAPRAYTHPLGYAVAPAPGHPCALGLDLVPDEPYPFSLCSKNRQIDLAILRTMVEAS